MDELTEKQMAQIGTLSDKILNVVMNTEMENPQFAIAALSHVAGVIAKEMKMPENVFLICMISAYQAILQAGEDPEVH
jgi:hypothetical protein